MTGNRASTTALPPESAIPRLRPYQCEAGRAVLSSVFNPDGRYGRHGRSISVQIARQGGKNELSAQIELLLLTAAGHRGDVIKCAPTFHPQLQVSRRRLWARIAQAGLRNAARLEPNAVRLGDARVLFLSAEAGANVVGHTAGLLLEVDEAQDVDAGKFDREFRPMAASTGATTVYYGTPWDDGTLLERAKQAHLEAERRDGVRRHFEYDWQTVAAHNPAYARFVEGERERLGATHPIFLTQYCLELIAGGGRLLTAAQRAQLAGQHERLAQPAAGDAYVAGLDLAGGDDPAHAPADVIALPPPARAQRDSTVLTIGRIVAPAGDALVQEPRAEIVEHIAWTGEPHETLLPRLVDLLRDTWRVARVAVDATGLGETTARLLAQALGEERVQAVKFSAERKSQLGFGLLAAINGGRLKMYRGDGSPEQREFWRQCERAKAAYRANRTMNFFVDPAEGHDDYLVSVALLVEASRDAPRSRVATGRAPGSQAARRRSLVAW
ncbi:MAG: phage terminase large subunit family protein [Dehalococcoidia bacterium]